MLAPVHVHEVDHPAEAQAVDHVAERPAGDQREPAAQQPLAAGVQATQVHWLASRAGKGSVVITKQPLDIDGNPWGDPITYKGKLKAVTPPEHDSTSNTEALLELEVTLAGTIT